MSLYARAGVPEYWIVDVGRQVLEVHREPTSSNDAALGWRYNRVKTLGRSEHVSALIASDVPIAVADLLP